MSSYAFDYVARQKLGGTNVTFTTSNQFIVPHPKTINRKEEIDGWVASMYSSSSAMINRLAELGFPAQLTPRDEGRRWETQCKIDAWDFAEFGYTAEDIDYVMETFPIVKRKEEAEFGEYRSKRRILEEFAKLN